MSSWPYFFTDMAIDLGTANTYVYVPGGGIVLKEPSIVAVNTVSGQVVAVGTEAQAMLGRTPPGLKAVRPLKAGVIADFDMTERMLAYFIKRRRGRAPVGAACGSSSASRRRSRPSNDAPSKTRRIEQKPARSTLWKSRWRRPWALTSPWPHRLVPWWSTLGGGPPT